MVQYFIDGGAFMWPILFSLLFGLAFAFERAYSLVLSSIDSNKFYDDVSSSMQSGKIQDAVDLCSETRGPVAGVFHAALSRYDRGLEEVEKAMENEGSGPEYLKREKSKKKRKATMANFFMVVFMILFNLGALR